MVVADDNDDMELDDDEIESNWLAVDDEPYLVVEDNQGQVVIEGRTVDCKR